MNDIQGVLFDADGTLIDTYDIILTSMRYAVNDVLGCVLDDAELMAGVGTPLYDQMLSFQRAATRLALPRSRRSIAITTTASTMRAFAPSATRRRALERFQAAGIPMGVVTSKRHAMAQRGLEMSGIADHFQFLIGHDDWPEHKPAPGPILRGCELLGVAPECSLYVGDSPFDIQAGNAAGCATAAALWGMFPREALAAERPTLMCDSLTGLADRLGI